MASLKSAEAARLGRQRRIGAILRKREDIRSIIEKNQDSKAVEEAIDKRAEEMANEVINSQKNTAAIIFDSLKAIIGLGADEAAKQMYIETTKALFKVMANVVAREGNSPVEFADKIANNIKDSGGLDANLKNVLDVLQVIPTGQTDVSKIRLLEKFIYRETGDLFPAPTTNGVKQDYRFGWLFESGPQPNRDKAMRCLEGAIQQTFSKVRNVTTGGSYSTDNSWLANAPSSIPQQELNVFKAGTWFSNFVAGTAVYLTPANLKYFDLASVPKDFITNLTSSMESAAQACEDDLPRKENTNYMWGVGIGAIVFCAMAAVLCCKIKEKYNECKETANSPQTQR